MTCLRESSTCSFTCGLSCEYFQFIVPLKYVQGLYPELRKICCGNQCKGTEVYSGVGTQRTLLWLVADLFTFRDLIAQYMGLV